MELEAKPQEKSTGKPDSRKCYNCKQRGHLAKNFPSALYCEDKIVDQGGGDRDEVVPGEAVGCGSGSVEERDSGGVASEGLGESKEVVGNGVLGVEVSGEGNEDRVVQKEVKVPVGDGQVGLTAGEMFNCGVQVNRCSTIEGRQVNDIFLDTGCSQTMVRQDFLPPTYRMTGRTVQIRCAHGDVTTYTLANVHLEIAGVGVETLAAVSKTLPVSALVSTDIPSSENSSRQTPALITRHWW